MIIYLNGTIEQYHNKLQIGQLFNPRSLTSSYANFHFPSPASAILPRSFNHSIAARTSSRFKSCSRMQFSMIISSETPSMTNLLSSFRTTFSMYLKIFFSRCLAF